MTKPNTEFQKRYNEEGPLTLTCYGCQRSLTRDQFPEEPDNWSRIMCSDCTGKIGKVTRSDGTESRRLSVYLPPDVTKDLRAYCTAHNTSLSKVTTSAIVMYLIWLDHTKSGDHLAVLRRWVDQEEEKREAREIPQ